MQKKLHKLWNGELLQKLRVYVVILYEITGTGTDDVQGFRHNGRNIGSAHRFLHFRLVLLKILKLLRHRYCILRQQKFVDKFKEHVSKSSMVFFMKDNRHKKLIRRPNLVD